MLTVALRSGPSGRCAAAAKVEAGALDAAVDLLAVAEAGPLDELQHARLDLVRAQLAFVGSRGSDAPALLLKAARRLGPIDAQLSRATYLKAMSAAIFAGRLAVGGGITEVAAAVGPAVRGLASPQRIRPAPAGLATHFNEGYAAALPILRKALTAFGNDLPAARSCTGSGWPAWPPPTSGMTTGGGSCPPTRRGGPQRRGVQRTATGADSRALMLLFAGELAAAGSLIDEVQSGDGRHGQQTSRVRRAGSGGLPRQPGRGGHADRDHDRRCDAPRRGPRDHHGQWANAVFNNGLGRYEEALAAATRAAEFHADLTSRRRGRWWNSSRRPRAAACAGRRRRLPAAGREAGASGTDWALGVERPLARADRRRRRGRCPLPEAIERLGRTRMRVELARAHLLYGEWLRREQRRG